MLKPGLGLGLDHDSLIVGVVHRREGGVVGGGMAEGDEHLARSGDSPGRLLRTGLLEVELGLLVMTE